MIKRITKKILGKYLYQRLSQKNYMRVIKKRQRELYDNIKQNRQFYKIHQGERCFILGNGPSLRDVDLKKLENEYVFSVNCFSRVNDFEVANTNYHLWMDYSFFELREDQKYNHEELMKDYFKMSKTGAKCFVPVVAYSFIKKYRIDENLDIHYLLLGESNVFEPEIKYELDKFITTYNTVVQFAIAIAIYMGFAEIYLVGCDTTAIISLLNNALNVKNKDMHAYDEDDTEERNRQILDHWTMTDILFDQYSIFHGYKVLNQFTSERNIILRNCSTKTLINEIPWMSLSDIFEGEY